MNLPDLEQKLFQYPASPLFARLAKEYLANGRVEEAKQLCVSGLQLYPSYTTAHLMLAQCYRAEHNFTRALEYLQEARTFLPDSSYLKSLYDEWTLSVTEPVIVPPLAADMEIDVHQQEAQAPLTDIVEEPLPEETQEIPVEAKTTELPPSVIDEFQRQELDAIENLQTQVAPIIEEAKSQETAIIDQLGIPPPPVLEESKTSEPVIEESVAVPSMTVSFSPAPIPNTLDERAPQSFDDGGRIVTKTLAEIYASQGAYAEAILTYQLLKHLRPEQSNEYDQRIKELEPKLQEKTF